MVYPASFFSTLDSKKYLIFHSSVAFAVPEYSLKEKDLRKRLHFLISLILAKISALAKSLWKSIEKKTSCQKNIKKAPVLKQTLFINPVHLKP